MREERLISRIVEGLKDMCYIWAKEMRSTITDEGVLIFFILVPLLYPLLYSWIYTNEVVREATGRCIARCQCPLPLQQPRRGKAADRQTGGERCYLLAFRLLE